MKWHHNEGPPVFFCLLFFPSPLLFICKQKYKKWHLADSSNENGGAAHKCSAIADRPNARGVLFIVFLAGRTKSSATDGPVAPLCLDSRKSVWDYRKSGVDVVGRKRSKICN